MKSKAGTSGVRNPAELVAWLGSPEDALQKLKDPCDPSRRQLTQITRTIAYSRVQLNLIEEVITWVTAYEKQDHPDSCDEEMISRWAQRPHWPCSAVALDAQLGAPGWRRAGTGSLR